MKIRSIAMGWGALAALVGCGGDDMPMEMMRPLPDLQVGDMSSMPCMPRAVPPVYDCQLIDPATAAPAAVTCHGTATAPAPGAMIDYLLEMRDFQTDDVVPEACVKFYADNVVPAGDTCDPMVDPVTDAMGQLAVAGPAGAWYAYHVFPKMGASPARTLVGSVQYNEPAPAAAAGIADGNTVSGATINLIPTILGFPRAVGTAVLAGQVQDCTGDAVYGALIRVFRSDGTPILEGPSNMEPKFRYFDGNDLPSADQPWTHTDGLYAAANIPVDGNPIYVEAWGRVTPGGPTELLGCEQVLVFADTVTIINVSPLRSDGPTSCPMPAMP